MPIYALSGDAPDLPAPGTYWVAPDAHVIGKVTLGSDVGVWFGAVLRGDNEPIIVGQGTNIQEGAMLHTDPGAPVTIGEGCTIGNNSLIGMGATVLNGAVIGNNCLVGANALITEGKEFPDNSLIVGSPARAIRTLDDKAIEGLRRSAEKYVANWQRFARDLKRLD